MPPELPVIYENPRFDASTPTLQPVINRAIRFGAVLMVEWGTLTLIEDAPRYLKITTVLLAVLILAVHESWPWLRMRGKGWYPILMGTLIAIYIGICVYAFLTESPHTRKLAENSADEIAAAVLRILPKNPPTGAVAVPPVSPTLKNPLDDEAVKWRLAKNLHYGTISPNGSIYQNANGRPCRAAIARYSTSIYGEDYAANLKELFDTIDWKYHEVFATTTLPRGLSLKLLRISSSTLGTLCGEFFLSRLNNDIRPPLNVVQLNLYGKDGDDQYMKVCTDACFEIDIGNEPDK